MTFFFLYVLKTYMCYRQTPLSLHTHVIVVYVSINKLEIYPFFLLLSFFFPSCETVNSHWVRWSDPSQDPSLSGLYVPRVGIGKTKHMLIVSQGVRSVSCSLKVSHTTNPPTHQPKPASLLQTPNFVSRGYLSDFI